MESMSKITLAAAGLAGAAALWYISTKKASLYGKDGQPLAPVKDVRVLLQQIAMASAQVQAQLMQQQQQLLRMGQQMDPAELKSAFLGEFVNQVGAVQAQVLAGYPGVEGGLSEEEFEGLLRMFQDDSEIRKMAKAIRDLYSSLGGEFTGDSPFAAAAKPEAKAPASAGEGAGATESKGAEDAGDDVDDIDDIDDDDDDAGAAPAPAPASGGADDLTLDKCFEIFDAANERMLEVFRAIKRRSEEQGLTMESPEAIQQLMMAQASSQTFVDEECAKRNTNMNVIQAFLSRPEHQMEMAGRLMESQQKLQKVMIEERLVPANVPGAM
uniref:Uncharacterized protein n=1 Tax=Phaeomonas parva TaxID=124430 RepID=A0A7S1XNV5_9STRA|mmetsp:Transcript_20251/g.61458  ORF Transcript_20251/g.61458 Transcript_20251/m.61458 type:complete len:326 (+) Transcript_20251:166-1143(+)